jgi:hypothetical protein
MSLLHTYWCEKCQIDIYGASPSFLAEALNKHNTDAHPFEFAQWDAGLIVKSHRYKNPDGKPLKAYTTPYGVSYNSRPAPESLTKEDEAFLSSLGVKW